MVMVGCCITLVPQVMPTQLFHHYGDFRLHPEIPTDKLAFGKRLLQLLVTITAMYYKA